jgi:hypothetical protein
MAIAVTQAKASRGNIWALHLERLFDPPRRVRAGASDGQRIRANPLHKLDQPSFPKISGRHFGWISFRVSVDCGATIAVRSLSPFGERVGVRGYRTIERL